VILMRRLPVLATVIVLVDTMLYNALVPLLPRFQHEFGFSKARAGLLVGACAAGTLVSGLAGGVAATRYGPRRAVVTGLALMGLASAGFALAESYPTLLAARMLQGISAGFTWSGVLPWLITTTPRERRGRVLGNTMGVGVFGSMLGPVVGALAAGVGRPAVFGTLAVLSPCPAAWTLQLPPGAAEHLSLEAIRRAARERSFLFGIAMIALGSLLFGLVSVLGPLRLGRAGWGAGAIGVVWLTAAILEALLAPISGRLSDSRGPLAPTRFSLTSVGVLSLLFTTGPRPLVLVPLVLLTAGCITPLYTASFALAAEGADAVGLAQGMSFGVLNAAWAFGAVAGPAAGGAIATATGDQIPFLLGATLCVLSLVVVRPGRVAAVSAQDA
jgi:MFS family permease